VFVSVQDFRQIQGKYIFLPQKEFLDIEKELLILVFATSEEKNLNCRDIVMQIMHETR